MDSLSRTHQRRAANDPESAARALQDRLRLGTLDLECVQIAALCGHEGAALLVDRPPARTLGQIMAPQNDSPRWSEALTRGALPAWRFAHAEFALLGIPKGWLPEQLAVAERWARGEITLEGWRDSTRRGHREGIPRPEHSPRPWLSQERMSRSVSRCVDLLTQARFQDYQRRLRDPLDLSVRVVKKLPVFRAETAEEIRGIVAQKMIEWVLK